MRAQGDAARQQHVDRFPAHAREDEGVAGGAAAALAFAAWRVLA